MSEHFYRMRTIFSGHESHRAAGVFTTGKKLVHYTPAANAINILKSKQIWLRNVRAMNDLSEVHHGYNLLSASLSPPADTPLETSLVHLNMALNGIFPGLADEVIHLFHAHDYALRHQTYVACLSEHDPTNEEFGRLSMWRSYSANQVGVAIVINPQPVQQLVTNFGVFASPVHYLKKEAMGAMITRTASAIKGAAEYLRNVSRDEVKGWYFYFLRSIATCSKHPGFQEEQEWRILHTRGIDNDFPLLQEVETINNIPQIVMKLPLQDAPAQGVLGLTLPSLIEKIIVGPCQYPWVICDALHIEMERAGIPDAGKKIVVSEIPLRT